MGSKSTKATALFEVHRSQTCTTPSKEIVPVRVPPPVCFSTNEVISAANNEARSKQQREFTDPSSTDIKPHLFHFLFRDSIHKTCPQSSGCHT
jgi:hypothetical protein